jgi:hypothetical protein
MTHRQFHFYKYVDDVDHTFVLKISEDFAHLAGLERHIQNEPFRPIGRNHNPRHMKLVATVAPPGQTKYRADVITNERDPSKVLNKLFLLNGIEMRCIRFVGEEKTAY